jgi:hypothetical protein
MSSLAPPYIDLGVPTDVWLQRPSSTIADIAFAPISETGIELTNDYEPVVYQANRGVMAANAAQEINDLQTRNHATTAYSTLDCHATPLFPTFNGQRAVDCSIRQARKFPPATMYPEEMVAQPVPPLGYPPEKVMGLAGFYDSIPQRPMLVRASVAASAAKPRQTPKPAAATRPRAAAKTLKAGAEEPKKERNAFARNMVNTVRGTFYDLANWKKLPPAQAGESSTKVFAYAVSRDDRTGYWMLWYAVIVMLIALIAVAVTLGTKKK